MWGQAHFRSDVIYILDVVNFVPSTQDCCQSILVVEGTNALFSLMWQVIQRRAGETNPFCLYLRRSQCAFEDNRIINVRQSSDRIDSRELLT